MLRARHVWELVEARAEATPDARLIVDEHDRELSFGGYRDAALRCAAGLAALGVGPDTPVSWQLPTWIESLVLVGGLARLGARQNPILPIYRERELAFITRQSEAALLLVPGTWRGFDYAALAADVARGRRGLAVQVVDRELPDGDPTSLAPRQPPAAGREAPVRWLFYSSGTTADPKGALHTDATLLAGARGMSQALDLRPDDRVALVFPFTHVGGIGWLLASLLVGFSHVAVEAFDPRTSIDVLARHRITQGTAGTAFHQAYLAAQRARPAAPLFPEIRAFPGGGAPKPPELHYAVKRELGGAGIVSGYGMTECPIASMNRPTDPDEKLAQTEGRASPAGEMELRIVASDDSLCGPDGEGEIRVRGPQLCRGYLDASLAAEAFDADGFFRTGDLGQLDRDGFLRVTGRLKDVIIRKGENVSAKEIEDLLFEHPKVVEVAVVGLPDAERGELVCAVVVDADAGDPLAFDEMGEWLRSRKLMLQKIPERLEHLAQLPRNPTGKVLKRELQARFSA